MEKKYWVLLRLIIIIGLIISLTPIIYGIFPITYDQGRDFLWVKNQVDFHQPALVGPQASIRGMFFGPLWFWLLSLPYIIFNGSPLAMTLFNALIVYSSVFIAAFIFRKIDQKISYFIIFLGFISPAVHGMANYAFSEHLLPILTILLIYSLAQILNQFNQKHFILSCFWISLMFHAEPPISIFSIPVLLIVTFLASRRQKFLTFKTVFLAVFVFIVPFLPLLIFDLRHDLIQIKSLYSFLSGDTRGLQEIAPMSFWQRLIDRPGKFIISFQNTIFNTAKIIVAYILIVLVDLTKRAKLKPFVADFLKAGLIYFLSLWVIFTLYPHEFKSFYLNGLKLIYIVWAAVGLSLLWQEVKSKKYLILFLSLIFMINLNPITFISSAKQKFKEQHRFGSLYVNQIQAVDWIYQNAAGQGFKVYVFVPAIYDYNYQYIFFWRGLNHYGYLPEEFSYQPGKSGYVPKKSEHLQQASDKIKPSGNMIYLIITLGSTEEKSWWHSGFSQVNMKLLDQYPLPDGTVVEKYKL